MEQFNLDTWLEDKSLKVVTKTGEEVNIIDTNAPDENNPIVGYILHKEKWNGPWSWHIDGTYKVGGDDMDLFFADNDGLTEFEKAVSEFIQKLTFNGNVLQSKDIKGYAKSLLDLARNELEKDGWRNPVGAYKNGYEQGKQDALKDLPKWKKCTGSTGPFIDYNAKGEAYLYLNDYAVKISELEKLPKSE